MTPEQLNFEAVLRERLAERARTLITADEQVRAFLQQAREYISGICKGCAIKSSCHCKPPVSRPARLLTACCASCGSKAKT